MKDKIKCPNCGHSFDVEEAISGKLEAHFRAEYERRVAEQADRFNEEKRKLEEERKQLSALRDNQEAMLKAELAKALENEKARIEKSAGEKYEEHIKALWEENEKRKSENKSLREKEVALMRQEAALKERQEEFELQVERQILEKQREIEEKARAKERESFEMEKVKLLKQIEDNKKLAEEMRRKAEQGSMQLQGEVQELALEDHLSRAYPFDRIQVGARVMVPPALQLTIDYDRVMLTHEGASWPLQERPRVERSLTLAVPGDTALPESAWRVCTEVLDRAALPAAWRGGLGAYHAWLDADRLSWPLRLRPRRSGDRLLPLGMQGSQSVKELMIDRKVPAQERDTLPILEAGGALAWVVGLRVDRRFAVGNNTKRVLHIWFEPLAPLGEDS